MQSEESGNVLLNPSERKKVLCRCLKTALSIDGKKSCRAGILLNVFNRFLCRSFSPCDILRHKGRKASICLLLNREGERGEYISRKIAKNVLHIERVYHSSNKFILPLIFIDWKISQLSRKLKRLKSLKTFQRELNSIKCSYSSVLARFSKHIGK